MHTVRLDHLPEPLYLRKEPLSVAVEQWSTGDFRADLPAAALYGTGTSEQEAIDDLFVTVADWVRGIKAHGGRARLGGPLLEHWDALDALLDLSRV